MKKIEADVLPLAYLPEEEAKQFADWVYQMRPLNMFQPDMLKYPRTVMCCAHDEQDTLLYIPLQPVLMFDAIAPKPGLKPREEALCLARVGEAVDKLAKDSGHGEICFFCRDDRVADLCARHGYEEIKGVRLLRRKI